MSSSSESTIYVGNLPPDVREKEVSDLFHKYGDIRNVELKTRHGESQSFAFVQFDSHRDAREAVRSRDGYDFDGKRLRVEFPRGAGPRGPGGRPMRDGGFRDGGRGGGGGFRDGGRDGGRGGFRGARQGGPLRRSNYRLIVEGLPPSGSWQDVKDHLREAGDICYANVENGQGIVEFTRAEDMHKAIRKFDDTKLRSHKGETGYIRLKEDSRPSRSRSPTSRRRSRSNTYSRSRSPADRRRRESESSASISPGRRRRASRSRSRDSSPRRRDASPDASPRDYSRDD